jgi:hypothetical protein
MEQEKRLRVALADRYTILHEIGSGGMATVCLAYDLKHDRQGREGAGPETGSRGTPRALSMPESGIVSMTKNDRAQMVRPNE